MRKLTYILILMISISCESSKREVLLKFTDGTIQVERIYPKEDIQNEYKYVEYYKNGNVKFEGFVKNGYYRGIKKNFYANGNPMEFCYLSDSGKFNYCCPDGFYELYYLNGNLEQTHYKKSNSIVGQITNYDSSGVKVNELLVKDNIKTGIAKYFYSSGKVRSIEYYKNDTLVEIVVDFHESGDTSFKAKIVNGNISFPIKKCNEKGECVYGDYFDNNHEKVKWIWTNNKKIIRTEIKEPSDSGFIIQDI